MREKASGDQEETKHCGLSVVLSNPRATSKAIHLKLPVYQYVRPSWRYRFISRCRKQHCPTSHEMETKANLNGQESIVVALPRYVYISNFVTSLNLFSLAPGLLCARNLALFCNIWQNCFARSACEQIISRLDLLFECFVSMNHRAIRAKVKTSPNRGCRHISFPCGPWKSFIMPFTSAGAGSISRANLRMPQRHEAFAQLGAKCLAYHRKPCVVLFTHVVENKQSITKLII